MGARAWWWGLGLALASSSGARADEAAYALDMQQARDALRAEALEDARRACRAAARAADEPKWGGPRGAAAWALCAEADLRAERPSAAVKALARAGRWALDDLRARRRHVAARQRVAAKAGLTADAKRAGAVLRQDILLQGLLRRPRQSKAGLQSVLRRLDEAGKLYREDLAGQAARLVEAARALVLARSGAPEEGARIAERLLAAPGPRRVREAALTAQYYARRAAEDPAGAARAAIQLNALRSQDLSEERRRFARGYELDQACRALDAEQGPGRCTRLQLEVEGYAALVDHSRGRPKAALSPDDLERVHADALPVLERCVLEHARRDRERFAGTDLRFSWTIDPGGRPVGPEIRPRRYAAELEACVKEAVLWIRYPRVRTQERTNVSVPYRLD